MNNTLLLIKNYFLIFLGSLTSKKNTKKYISGGLICVLIGLLMISTFCSTSILTTSEFLKLSSVLPGAERMAMYSNIVMGLLMMGLFTVMRSIYPTKNSDFNMLSSLPLTKLQIITSKVVYGYLFDIVSFIIVILPSFIVYYVMVPNTSIMIIVWGILFVMLGAIISNGLSYIIGLLFLKLSVKFKNFGLIQSIFTLLLAAGFLIIQYSIPGYLSDFTQDPIEYINNLGFMKILINWILDNNLVYFTIILVVCLFVYIVSLVLRVYFFGKSFKSYQTKEKELLYDGSSILKRLYLKEIKYYFHTPIYFVNTIIGCLFVVGSGVAYRIIGKEQVLAFMNALPSSLQISENILIVILLSVLLSITTTTSSSISLEGKNLWILKSNPIKISDIFLSKILLNLTLSFPASFISAILFTDFLNPVTFIPFFLIPFLNSIVTSALGLLINLYYPKLDWNNEEEVVKKSMSVGLSMGLCLLTSLILPVVYFIVGKTWSFGIFSIFGVLLEVVLIIIVLIILKNKGTKKFIDL